MALREYGHPNVCICSYHHVESQVYLTQSREYNIYLTRTQRMDSSQIFKYGIAYYDIVGYHKKTQGQHRNCPILAENLDQAHPGQNCVGFSHHTQHLLI